MSSSAEKTEKATPKKREDARKKGQIARGAELPAALSFLGALVALNVLSTDIVGRAGNLFAGTMIHAADHKNLTAPEVHNMILEGAKVLAMMSLPIIAVSLAASLAGNFAQGGLTLTAESLKPNANKFNPANNIKRIFGMDSAVNLIKTVLKLILLGWICYSTLSPIVAEAPALINAPLITVIVKLGEAFYSLGLRIGMILLLLALADYAYVWYKHEKSLKMTKQEIRDEFKEQEGDPLVKSKRRSVARAMVQKRSLAEVPNATVVITNPTHFAVALRYDREKDAAPIVIAKGADNIAFKIREIAKENEITLVENPPLARSLYKVVEPNQIIPVELFSAVAEVLAFVYRQKAK